MKRIGFLIVVLFLLVMPVLAQDTTPPADTISLASLLPWVAAVVLILVVGIIYIAHRGIVEAAKSAPQWSIDATMALANAVLDSVSKYVLSTETKTDDAAYAELKARVDTLIAEIRTARLPPAG